MVGGCNRPPSVVTRSLRMLRQLLLPENEDLSPLVYSADQRASYEVTINLNIAGTTSLC